MSTSKTKYVVIKYDGQTLPFTFPNVVVHSDFVRALGARGTCTGAGFCYINSDGEWVAYGRSESLNVASHADDSDYLNCYLKGQ